jgi:DNA-directed RNA polymerase subunit K/omega
MPAGGLSRSALVAGRATQIAAGRPPLRAVAGTHCTAGVALTVKTTAGFERAFQMSAGRRQPEDPGIGRHGEGLMGWKSSLRPFAFGVPVLGVQEWATGTDGVFRRLTDDGR